MTQQTDALHADVHVDRTWQDETRPVAERVDLLLAAMTLEEKVGQLGSRWIGNNLGGEPGVEGTDLQVAPMQDVFTASGTVPLEEASRHGLGHLTRIYGSRPVTVAEGADQLVEQQHVVVGSSRFGIPALVHEECLTGFTAYGATVYPAAIAWGATWDPDLVRRMAAAIGHDMAALGVHQGLSPVLDVVRDYRWGRVEETIGEDPYLIGAIGTAYVRGLESVGIVATLKHFVGYSASKAGRNLAPVSIGMRERNDVLLPPFEMALRLGGARSVMHAYTDIDGVPSAADASLLTELLRDEWGFTGTVVADYFGVAFLKMLHGVAGSWADAAVSALTAGVDVELPTVKTFGAPLVAAIEADRADVALVDRALRRVLAQKIELGLLDDDWTAEPSALAAAASDTAEETKTTEIDLDSAANRAVARELAEKSVVLLSNDGLLPLTARGASAASAASAATGAPLRIAVIGPNADTPFAVLGCYSFPAHVGVQHPHTPVGIDLPTLLQSVRAEFPQAQVDYVPGTTIDGGETDFAAAIEVAKGADVVILALGDRAGLFGRGTSGEGCDVESLRLPGTQQELTDAIIATGTPTVVTLLSGRPYALGSAVTGAAAIVQTFFPGEEGTPAIAGVLSGRVNPSGRLPVSVPSREGSQPTTYLAAPLAQASDVSNLDPTPAFAFGHGLSFTPFVWSDFTLDNTLVGVDAAVSASLVVTNPSDRAGADVVQVYLHDPVASVVRPVQRLVGFARVELEAGQSARVRFTVPTDLAQFTGRDGRRVVEPGAIELRFARSSADVVFTANVELVGMPRYVDHTRELVSRVEVS